MNSEDSAPERDLTGRILISSPALQDPHFIHTLVYIAQHSREGAVGVIMNRPTGKVLSDTGGTGPFPPAMAAIPLHVGGPVNPSFVTIGVFRPGATDRIWSCSFSEPPEKIVRVLEGDAHAHVRAYVGYAGWGEGQLENELKEGSWRVSDPSRALFHAPWTAELWTSYHAPGQVWRELLDFLPATPGWN